jgi:hypothetical protein
MSPIHANTAIINAFQIRRFCPLRHNPDDHCEILLRAESRRCAEVSQAFHSVPDDCHMRACRRRTRHESAEWTRHSEAHQLEARLYDARPFWVSPLRNEATQVRKVHHPLRGAHPCNPSPMRRHVIDQWATVARSFRALRTRQIVTGPVILTALAVDANLIDT